MSILPVGGALIGNNKVKLTSSKKVEQVIFSNPDMNDVIKDYNSGKEAKSALEQFGKFAKNVLLDDRHSYQYLNAQGAAQLYDKTAQSNVISVVKRLRHPFRTFLKTNFLDKFVK